ncbi:D123-domain-containing protein [Mycena rosella]|uniref:D123-domain-containing protein n=1 Tax=Mycena rosella TaxID=1033263 RepID=A0AAD7CYW1_MYCRO|nr:D123-domain-containing protein [Mycena rosella]
MSFPEITAADILRFQFSSWYPIFSSLSIRSTIVRPLPQDFLDYLHSDGVHVPEGADDLPAETTLSDDEDGEDSDDEGEPQRRFAFPGLDAQIRACISNYGAVFPKLNFSSPQDAAWILPAGSPLKCTSPADVYMLLKSSDFVTHDLSAESVFDGCSDGPCPYELELVLRKWYPVDRSRELRCFVRQNTMLGISQRDINYYDYLNDEPTRARIVSTVRDFWETNIRPRWDAPEDYTFDLLLTRDLSRGHILDFNPYAVRTDPLLFTYDELHALSLVSDRPAPELRVIDSRAHPAATSNAPAHQHNMIPFEALSLSSGRDVQEFADAWEEGIRQSVQP